MSNVLSPRETEVLRLLHGGRRNKEIANLLNITDGTVKVQMRSILGKLGLRNRVEAALWAERHPEALNLGEGTDDDLLTCEACGEHYDCDAPGAGSSLDGADFCPACWAGIKADMAACDHVWEAYDGGDVDGPARICSKCSKVEEVGYAG